MPCAGTDETRYAAESTCPIGLCQSLGSGLSKKSRLFQSFSDPFRAVSWRLLSVTVLTYLSCSHVMIEQVRSSESAFMKTSIEK